MIPQKYRLPRERFRARDYRTIITPFFSLKTKENKLLINRLGVVVGKSVDKRAVRRNFWERQAKMQLLRAPHTGRDLIVTIFPKVSTLTKKRFVEEIEKILKIK